MKVTYKGNDLNQNDFVFQVGMLQSARLSIDVVLRNCSYDMYQKLREADQLLIDVIRANKVEIEFGGKK